MKNYKPGKKPVSHEKKHVPTWNKTPYLRDASTPALGTRAQSPRGVAGIPPIPNLRKMPK